MPRRPARACRAALSLAKAQPGGAAVFEQSKPHIQHRGQRPHHQTIAGHLTMCPASVRDIHD
jgi:hypothetical protein